jgi:hypothetical protein
MKKVIIWVSGIFVVALASCGNLDVVAKDSVRAFGEMVAALPKTPESTGRAWEISAPDGSAVFVFNKDFAETTGMRGYNAYLSFPAGPFVEAGLDITKLPPDMISEGGNTIIVGASFNAEGKIYPAEDTAIASYSQLVDTARSRIGYHSALDHYGINLGGGNMFEWAKNLQTNDKDIVFVLNPAPFIEAGADPAKISGWVFAKVTADDETGKPVESDKLLKPFNLE